MVQIDAKTGMILQEYAYDDGVGIGLSHNAYANVVLDDDDNTYHIDSVYGMVSFDGTDLSKGPVWTAIDIEIEVEVELIVRKRRALKPSAVDLAKPRDKDNKNIVPNTPTAVVALQQNNDSNTLQQNNDSNATVSDEQQKNEDKKNEKMTKKNIFVIGNKEKTMSVSVDEQFTAYQTAIDESNFRAVYYACTGSAVVASGEKGYNVDAISYETKLGDTVWSSTLHDGKRSRCDEITDDVQWAPSLAAFLVDDSNTDGIYVARESAVQCFASNSGDLLWTYPTVSSSPKVVVSSDRTALVIQRPGSIVSLQTTEKKVPIAQPTAQPTAQSVPSASSPSVSSPAEPTLPTRPAIEQPFEPSLPTFPSSPAFDLPSFPTRPAVRSYAQ